MRRVPFDTFDRPWLVLCEGDSDKKLIDRLLVDRGISDRSNFHVQFPDRKGGRGGRSLFGDYLANLQQVSPSFRDNVKALLVVSDNDLDLATSLKEVRDELKKAQFPVPPAERVVKRAAAYPSVVILMLPKGIRGNLETLCVEAAHQKWGLKVPLDTFVAAAPANAWGIGDQSKARLQAMLAMTCETNPAASLGYLWAEPPQYHLPLSHPAFDDLADFLRGFGALVK